MVKEQGVSYPEAARRLFGGQGSLGNGAAMRIAPVGLLYHDHPDLYRLAGASAEVTHAHPVGMDGAAIQAAAVARALKMDPGEAFPVADFLQGLLGLTRTPEIRSKIEAIEQLIRKGASPEDAAEGLGRTVAVHESMPFALYSFLTHPESFEECLFCAILNGGDRDTLGAMACAVSGAYLGIASLPRPWKEKLENREYIKKLALGLVELAV
jgi:poly(ADP-ribose) glycohydrolase ARH3